MPTKMTERQYAVAATGSWGIRMDKIELLEQLIRAKVSSFNYSNMRWNADGKSIDSEEIDTFNVVLRWINQIKKGELL